MIYGLNFGAPDIPTELKLTRRIKRPVVQEDGKTVKQTLMCLVGVCHTEAERVSMSIQADNGHRKQYWVVLSGGRKPALNCLYVY